MSAVILYTTATCGYCHQAKQYLAQRGIPFTEYDVAADARAADEMVRLSGQRGVPVIVIDGRVVVGFDRPRLEQLLASRSAAPPRLGLSVADASSIALKRGSGPSEGAYVGRVKPLSLGERAGAMKGDVIIELAGRPVRNADDLEAAASALRHGQVFGLVLLRNGQKISAQVEA